MTITPWLIFNHLHRNNIIIGYLPVSSHNLRIQPIKPPSKTSRSIPSPSVTLRFHVPLSLLPGLPAAAKAACHCRSRRRTRSSSARSSGTKVSSPLRARPKEPPCKALSFTLRLILQNSSHLGWWDDDGNGVSWDEFWEMNGNNAFFEWSPAMAFWNSIWQIEVSDMLFGSLVGILSDTLSEYAQNGCTGVKTTPQG